MNEELIKCVDFGVGIFILCTNKMIRIAPSLGGSI